MSSGVWALGGVLLGFLLAQGAQIAREVAAQRGRWAALRAEIIYAGYLARGYIGLDARAAPLMRVPPSRRLLSRRWKSKR